MTGDLVTARIALGRALVADPDYTFARLLYEAVNCGAEPRSLCATLRAERRARQRQRRRRHPLERRRVLGGQRVRS
ncbi:DUF4192 family protein [Streptacidiphilus sp. 4-A2]|nr:DUF4192 family protein [Streptacidiphilus sp. 4-A2]